MWKSTLVNAIIGQQRFVTGLAGLTRDSNFVFLIGIIISLKSMILPVLKTQN